MIQLFQYARDQTISPDPALELQGARLLHEASKSGDRLSSLHIAQAALHHRLITKPSFQTYLRPALTVVQSLATSPDPDPMSLSLFASIQQVRGVNARVVRQLHSRAVSLVLRNRKKYRERADHSVLAPSDVLVAYATFLVGPAGAASRDSPAEEAADRNAALELFRKAALEGGHEEACLALVTHAKMHTLVWWIAMRKLAASGKKEAARQVALMYAMREKELDELKDLEKTVRDEILREVRTRVWPPAPWIPRSVWRPLLLEYLEIQRNVDKEDHGRLVFALEWFTAAAQLGDARAALEGAMVAWVKLRMPCETVYLIREVFEKTERSKNAEHMKLKADAEALLNFWCDSEEGSVLRATVERFEKAVEEARAIESETGKNTEKAKAPP